MNIALIIERFNPDVGGAEKSTAQMAWELSARGHAVTILTWWHPPGLILDGVKLEARSKKASLRWYRLLQFSRWVRKRLAERGFDASVSVTTAAAASVLQPRSGTIRATLGQNVAMRRSIVARLAKRAVLALSPKLMTQLYLERRTLSDSTVKYIAAVSRYVREQIENHYGIDPERIRLIPNASDMPRPSKDQRRRWRRVVRAGFGVEAEGTTLFLFAAYNPKLKGAATLLRAVQLLKQRDVNAVVLMAGKVNYRMLRDAASLDVRDRVRFVGSTKRMAELFCAADVTVLPTWYDPSSKVVIESLMLGTPVISTVCNGSSDLITANGSDPLGRVLPDPGDAVALADAMMALCDPGERRKCRPDSRRLAETLSMKRHVDLLEQLIAEAAGTTPGTTPGTISGSISGSISTPPS